MQLKNIMLQDSALQYVVEHVNVLSSIGRKVLYASIFSTDADYLEREYDHMALVIQALQQGNAKAAVENMEHALMCLQDITNTLYHLQQGNVLDDIELYEIKHFILISETIRQALLPLQWVNIPCLEEALDILDPEHLRVDTFYVYDVYSQELAQLRKQARNCQGNVPAEIIDKINDTEDGIRRNLSRQLTGYVSVLQQALQNTAYLDVLLAKSRLCMEMHLCRPAIGNACTQYKGLFNPQIKSLLQAQNKEYQPIDVQFGDYPTIITGINMGGKTLLLKTLALAQALCQLGFYVPAVTAQIALVQEVMTCIDDEQNPLKGLSSFAAEMKKINEILSKIEQKQRVLVLIDELARTTNPHEGRAIVSALADILQDRYVPSFITTHYDMIDTSCKRLRVKGLRKETQWNENKDMADMIDYALVEDDENTVPEEALKIAEMLQVNKLLINKAKQKLQREE